jgi:OOP family OmpA-OmpF porin
MRFSPLLRIGLALILVASLGGCATTPPGVCAVIGAGYGAIGGGVGGGLYANNNTGRDNNEWEGAGIAAASMLVGAGVGYLGCRLMQEEPKPEPRRVTQAPTPPPKPAPTPAPPPKPDPCTGLVRLEGVKFDHDKSELGPNAGSILDETVTALQRCPQKRVRLDAYTDSAGSDAYNQALSQRRADSVRAYLVQHGVAAARIDARGLGESNPVASNDTAEGRAQNRRVELQPID